MKTSISSKLRNLVPAALVFVTVGFLASCTSSNKVASSFGKRKYTHGHFSDPVAKVKTNYKPAGPALAIAQPKGVDTKNTPAVQKFNSNTTTVATSDNKATAPVAATNSVTKAKHGLLNINLSKSSGLSISSGSTTLSLSSNNVSLKENSTNSQAGYNEHGSSSSDSGMNHYLKMCLLFLAIWLICILLEIVFAVGTATTGSAGSFGLAVLFGLIGWICFIVSIVFFILWLVDISK